jgi:hypothetical protein
MLLPPPALIAPAPITHHQAKAHPIRYHLALPEGWQPGRSWPVVVVVSDAHRDFEANLQRFVQARGTKPYILAAPEVLTCGGARDQSTPPYSYTAADWAKARAGSDSDFDDAGLEAMLADIHDRWAGEAKAFLTGWEAGGHTVWAQALRRPERWRAVAPVSSNYQGRGLSEATFSKDPARTTLPIRVFWCGAPTGDAVQAMGFFHHQTDQAKADAKLHGFAAISEEAVPGKDHGPLPEAVLAWFEGQMGLAAPVNNPQSH